MIQHKIMCEDSEDAVYIARAGSESFILEIHNMIHKEHERLIRISFTELDVAGLAELRDACVALLNAVP